MSASPSSACPPVTVLMSVYNGARFLNEALDSIRSQTFRDFEFLIIDDGSSDQTPAILARHAASDARIRIVTQENRGLIPSLNRGFAEARGEFIARMDADDVSRPYRLAAQMQFLSSRSDIVLVGGAIEVIDEEGRAWRTIRLPEEPEQVRRHMRELGCAVAHPTVMFRRLAVLQAGGLRPAYRHAEDYDLWLRMIEKHDFANLPEVLLSYRRSEGSVSSQHAAQQVLAAFCARLAARRRLEGAPDPTSNVPLITPEVVLAWGVGQEALNAEMLRGLYEAADMAIDQGRRSAAAEFLTVARPYATAARLHATALDLNRKAVTAPASTAEQIRHRRLLLEAAPDLHREVFAVDVRAVTAGSGVHSFAGENISRKSLPEMLRQNRYDTDKSEACLREYECAFAHLRDGQIALMEIGVGRGGSLSMWRDYFSRGTIVGVDRLLPAGYSDGSGRVHIYQCEQADASALSALATSASPTGFDIIIDDASHLGALTAATFKTLFYDHLRPGGFYAIEAWGTAYWDSWPDGACPPVSDTPAFPNDGRHFPSHDLGMAGFVKQLLDECALSDIFHPRFGIPRTRKSWIRSMHVSTGLVIIQKEDE